MLFLLRIEEARYSNSMAAWPSKVFLFLTPTIDDMDSKSLPALEVKGELIPFLRISRIAENFLLSI